jgi:5-methylthioadenosine/S-adenosylhomocysteine deaminase
LNLPEKHIVAVVQRIDNYGGVVDWNQTKAFVIHLGEGTDSLSRAEFGTLKMKGLLHANTTIIHGTAFGTAEFSEMAATGAKLVWSPQSNLTLYGKTTDIKAARQAGVKLALGVDWNLTGSDSIFDEARVARAVNSEEFDEAIPESEWLSLVTANAADVLALGSHVGRITQGLKADIVVLRRRDDEPNRSFLKSDLEDVEWVMIGGQSLYGNEATIQQLRPDQCEPITVHRSRKRICMPPIQTLAGLQQVLLNAYPDLAPLAP